MSDEYRICCNAVHVKTATWAIAIMHSIECGLTLLSGALYYTGITDGSRYGQSVIGTLNTAGWAQRYGFGGLMVAALIWLVFIGFLIYGLRNNRATYVMLHLIYSAVMFGIFVLVTVLSFVDGRTLGNTVWFIVFAVVLFLLLYVEYKCYQYLKHSVIAAVGRIG